MRTERFITKSLLVLACLACLTGLAGASRAADLVVVKSKELSVYDKAVAGFKTIYKGSTAELVMKGDLTNGAKLAEAVRAENPKAIFAVGLRAVKTLKAEIADIPIVFCMAMQPAKNKLNTKNAAGVDLEPSALEQLKAFKEAIPTLKNIGIVYDPKRTGTFVQTAKQAAPTVGLTLVAVEVAERREVMAAFEKVTAGSDAVWIIRDPTVLTREFFNHTLIVQFEKKIPLLAYSDQFVKKGAVVSFSSGYADQGKKAAEIVNKILEGTSPADIPIQTPAGTITINTSSAQKANVQIPASVSGRADVVKVK